MSRVYFIADLHFGHKNIMNFAGEYRHGDSELESRHITIALWNARITKGDVVYVLGDVAFTDEGLNCLQELNGMKYLVRGNHDKYKTKQYLRIFKDIFGFSTYKGFWISHAPIHPSELRGRRNIHGHVHQNTIRNAYGEVDERYINVSIENTDGAPVAFKEIQEDGWLGRVERK